MRRKFLQMMSITVLLLTFLLSYIFIFECFPMGRKLGDYLIHTINGDYNVENYVQELYCLQNYNTFLYKNITDETISDYETNKTIIEVADTEIISDFIVNEEYLFYKDSMEVVHQCTVEGNEVKVIQLPEKQKPYSLVYANKNDLYVMDEDRISIWSIEKAEQYEIIEGFTKYAERKMEYARSVVDENNLIILGTNYNCIQYDGNNVASNGTVGDYNGAVISFVDLNTKKVVREYEILEGEVVYMDASQYAIIKNGVIAFYNYTDDKMKSEYYVKGYIKPKLNDWASYEFVNYKDKIQVFNLERMIDEIKIEN